jgi:hypothetical protein
LGSLSGIGEEDVRKANQDRRSSFEAPLKPEFE